jgi:hypothetical protein
MNQIEKVFEDVLSWINKKNPNDESYEDFINEFNSIPQENKLEFLLAFLGDRLPSYEEIKKHVKEEQNCWDYSINVTGLTHNFIYSSVKDVEKKKHGEVMTPITLVNEMLNKLPEDTWSNPHIKILDPSNGIGTFISVIVGKFMKGLDYFIEDECERYKYIIENIIYVCEIQPNNMLAYFYVYNKDSEYNLKTYYGSFLEKGFNEHMSNVWGISNFDIVLGNPPYQYDESDGDNKLYLEFTKKSISILKFKGHLLFITPKSILDYLTNVSKNRKYVDDFYNIKYLSIDCPSKYFDVGSTFVYFLLCKEHYKENTTIEYIDGNGNEVITQVKLKEGFMIPSKPSEIDLTIISKITSTEDILGFDFMRKVNGDKTVRYRNTTKSLKYNSKTLSDNQNDVFRFPLIHKINKTNPYPGLLCYCSEELKDMYRSKVLISRSGYLMPSFDNGGLGITDNMNYVNVENELDGNNIIFLLNSIIRKYLEIQFSKSARDRILTTVYNLKKVNIKSINNITENTLFNLYNLTEEEIIHLKKITN